MQLNCLIVKRTFLKLAEYNNLVEQHADGIYRFALKHLKNEMDAQDIVQNTYLKTWEKHETIALENGKSYLFTVAINLIRNYVSYEKRFTSEEHANHHSYNESSSQFDLKEILENALDQLPEIQKTVILLRDYEGYNYEEIGKITDLSESQVKVYIFRARKTLQGILKDQTLVV